MPAYSTPPPGVPAEMWQQIQGAYSTAEQDPAWVAAQKQKADQLNAYRSAQTASMGMMTSGPNSTVAADPSTAFQRFVQSGYTPQQAMADGWATSGNGNKGWESMVGYQAPLNPQGLIGSPYAQQQIQQYQAQQQPMGAGANPFGSQPRNNPASQAYGMGAPSGRGIYQQLGSMLGGGAGQSNPFAQYSGGSSGSAPQMQASSGMPPGGYGQRQNAFAQSPSWQGFLSNFGGKQGG